MIKIIGALTIVGVVVGIVVLPFVGIPIKNNEGQYQGYVTAIERRGAIFKGWNVYLKTELESSDTDFACVNRDDATLIAKLKEAQEKKENVSLKYEGVWVYGAGVCPGTDWMVIGIN